MNKLFGPNLPPYGSSPAADRLKYLINNNMRLFPEEMIVQDEPLNEGKPSEKQISCFTCDPSHQQQDDEARRRTHGSGKPEIKTTMLTTIKVSGNVKLLINIKTMTDLVCFDVV